MNRIDEPGTRDRALELLSSEGVVVLPTDTQYGLHAAVSSSAGVERIRELKGGEPGRRFVLLAASIEMVDRYVASFGCASREGLSRRWPSPLTVILPAGPRCPSWIGDTVAVRIPKLPELCEIVESLGEPIVSTSVNLSGQPPANDPADIEKRFEVDFVVADVAPGNPNRASTIVDLCGESPRVVRRGDYDWSAAAGASNPSK